MKRVPKFFIVFVIQTLMIAACENNNAPKSRILGDWLCWDDTKHVELIFEENNKLIYYEGPIGSVAWGGETIMADYRVSKHSLITFSFGYPLDTIYSTNFHMKEKYLTIEVFPHRTNLGELIYETITFTKK